MFPAAWDRYGKGGPLSNLRRNTMRSMGEVRRVPAAHLGD